LKIEPVIFADLLAVIQYKTGYSDRSLLCSGDGTIIVKNQFKI